ncbi:MAG: DUF1992 domain-containing protein [Syntrophomonadaceae bacterium]|nr:DUF1992 domain-containing protein [Syntrophomonadaceae bacterium]
MEEKSIEEQVMIKAGQARKLAKYMSSTQDLVEEQIQKAFMRGDFDNLEGAGKPLNLYENPYEPSELRMTFRILKNNDFAPYWIELGKEIDGDFEKLAQEVEYFKKYTLIILREKPSSQRFKRYERKKANFYREIRSLLNDISHKITDYNLHCPTFREGRANIMVDERMYQVIREIEQVIEGNIYP